MSQKTAIIENRQLRSLIRRTVMDVVQEVLADPDYGLALKPSFIKRLQESANQKKAGRVVSFDKILRKYQNQ